MESLGIRTQRPIDFEFLSLKYRDPDQFDPESFDYVYYKMFYDDYDKMESEGLGSKIWGLQKDIMGDHDSSTSKMEEDPFKIIIDEKFIRFYNSLRDKLLDTRRDWLLIDKLISADPDKTGFVSSMDIANAFQDSGIFLKNKQVGQVTFPLHQDFDKLYSYPELIEFIFGQKRWLRVMKESGLTHLVSMVDSNSKKSMSRLLYSEQLRFNMEFMYSDILHEQTLLADKNDGLIDSSEVFLILSKVGIKLNNNDAVKLKNYLDDASSSTRGCINFEEVFREVNV